ncbi:Aspartic proteinase nepenthesin-2 [Ananas comosus]|nr:Aspartic proteinase nepenthesin-2 [Ananas comosus]
MSPTFAEQPGKSEGEGEGEGEGLTLELIHRYSIRSPLYSPNLTTVEMIKQLVEISDRRYFEIAMSLAHGSRLMGVRPIVAHDKWLYMVKLGIGNPPTFTRLHLDTGSNIMWTQCAPCRSYFPQLPPLYWPAKSRTYRTLPCDHRLCAGYPCINNKCHYEMKFFDGTYTKGIIAAERFTFASNLGGRSEAVDGVGFGCSKESSSDMYPRTQAVSGILGLGSDVRSFLMQLGDRAKGRFSYCLVPLEHTGQSYLRFGTDVERIKHAQTTPILPKHELEVYSLELKDLSVDGRLLRLPPDTFKVNRNGTGGCIIDSGLSVTFMIGEAFDALVHSLEEYFQNYDLRKIEDPRDTGLELCYKKPRGFSSYPTVGFHLRGAVFRPKAKSVFLIDEALGTFCLFVRKGEFTLLAAVLQQNFRMVFDVRKRKLTFAEENCARD